MTGKYFERRERRGDRAAMRQRPGAEPHECLMRLLFRARVHRGGEVQLHLRSVFAIQCRHECTRRHVHGETYQRMQCGMAHLRCGVAQGKEQCLRGQRGPQRTQRTTTRNASAVASASNRVV